jgi:hypothetical protein
MKALSLLAGVFVLAATALPGTANAQYCMTDSFAKDWTISVHGPSDIIFGSMDDNAPFTWMVSGGRGVNNATARHHSFSALNGNAEGGAGCDDGTGFVDWFTYNGNVSPTGGGTYSFSGSWYNSCGSSGTVTATIVPGACRSQAPPAPGPGDPSLATAVQADAGLSAEDYAVASYPNPTADAAVISYTVPERGAVNLTVYDVLGRQVAVLVSGTVEAGTHTATFDARGLSAGTYVYRLQVGNDVQTGRLSVSR